MRVLASFQPDRNTVYPDVPTWKELGFPIHYGINQLLIGPKGLSADVVKYVHDAARASMEEPAFRTFAQQRVVLIDYRGGEKLKAEIWQEYRAHTELLRRIGMLKK
jgi:putative tricarboxylic transport membrane protein